MRKHYGFKPLPLFQDPHTQTIIGSLLPPLRKVRSLTKYIKLPDQDEMTCEVSQPDGWDGTSPTVVMIHGLCGSTKSAYLVRLARTFYKKGIRCIRVNLRGCGSSRKCRGFYNSGCSIDILTVLEHLKSECPDSPIFLVAFSLGGNISLKLAGELGEDGNRLIASLIAINPPIDLYSSAKLFRRPENRFYEHYFYKHLRADVYHRHRRYKDLPRVRLPRLMSLYEFDEYYMAPSIGFGNAMEYYDASSSRYYIPNIKVPCRILFSEDDPIIDSSVINEIDLPDNVSTYIAEGGGHLGFLSSPEKGKKGVRWMDALIESWIDEDLRDAA